MENLTLNSRQICDLELLINGGFNPLEGFLKKNDYESVLKNMRLADGSLWTMPITLAITSTDAEKLKHCDTVTLKDPTGLNICTMDISGEDSIYKYDWQEEAKYVFGTDDTNHPYTKILKEQYEKGYKYYLGGKIIKGIIPPHFDFLEHRLSPSQTKEFFKKNNWKKVIGFQTRNPMHKSHYFLTQKALQDAGEDAKLLLHPVVGVTQECDVNYHTRVRCYKKLLNHYQEDTVKLSLLPLSMRMAGPREAVWHAQIRKNYGCTHFVVGRDHAGPSYKTKDGESFFGPYDAQELLLKHADEIGIKVLYSKFIVYALPKDGGEGVYMQIDKIDREKYDIQNISGTQQRELLNQGKDIPEWFTFPDVVKELKLEYKPVNQRGLCLYFVGLSGSGKTTLAKAVEAKLRELIRDKQITYLDGDIVRTHLSKGLGFSREDRSTNVRRIGYVASEVVKHGGLSICANIAPYQEDRLYNRKIISNQGNYIQIWVNTSLEECENRDCKGLYKLARAGKIKEFTGISDPFETPDDSDLIVDGTKDLNELVNIVINQISNNNLLKFNYLIQT